MMRRNEGFNRGGFAPVKVGEELDVKIEAVGEKGDGIAKKNGFVLFVPNTKEGDEVKVRITKVLRKVGFAEVVGEGSKKSEGTSEEAPEKEKKEDLIPEGEDSENFGDESEESDEESKDSSEEETKEEF